MACTCRAGGAGVRDRPLPCTRSSCQVSTQCAACSHGRTQAAAGWPSHGVCFPEQSAAACCCCRGKLVLQLPVLQRSRFYRAKTLVLPGAACRQLWCVAAAGSASCLLVSAGLEHLHRGPHQHGVLQLSGLLWSAPQLRCWPPWRSEPGCAGQPCRQAVLGSCRSQLWPASRPPSSSALVRCTALVALLAHLQLLCTAARHAWPVLPGAWRRERGPRQMQCALQAGG